MYWSVNKNTSQPDGGNKIDETAAKYGFTASELGLGVSTPKTTSNKAQKAKAPAKYANHANPEKTWAGGKGLHLYAQSSTYRPRPVPRIRS